MTEQGAHENTGGFEIFDPEPHGGLQKGHPGTWLPRVRLDKAGSWTIIRPALELMGNPRYVTLWYDAQKGRVGFKPAKEGDYAAYPVRRSGRRSHQGIVTGKKFCKYHGIRYEESKTYPARLEGEFLVIDVRE
jgi:hypothetical protein